MTSTARTDSAERAYRALIAELSPTLPHVLDVSDVKLSSADLAIVVAQFGGAEFVSEALNDQDTAGRDTIDGLVVRVSSRTFDAAITSCGIAVMDAVTRYAARLVHRDVQAFRDANPPRRRESLASEYGVSGLVTGGAL